MSTAAATAVAASVGQKRSLDAATEPDSKKWRGEHAKDISAACSTPSAPSILIGPNDVRLAVYDPTAPPQPPMIRSSIFINPAAPPTGALSHFLSEWGAPMVTNAATAGAKLIPFKDEPLSPLILTHIRRAFNDLNTKVNNLPGLLYHPKLFVDKDLNAVQYAQILPFKLTIYLQRPQAQRSSFVYRFTTLPNADSADGIQAKASYAFSPLPPVLVARSARDNTTMFRARLATQMRVAPSTLKLALLRPSEDTLLQDEVPDLDAMEGVEESGEGSSLFQQWLDSQAVGDGQLQLGLFDAATKHTLSTSHVQERVNAAPSSSSSAVAAAAARS